MLSGIGAIMDIAKKAILAQIRPLSIFLIGSFGRNEGSILFEEGEQKLLRDIDILVVVRRRFSASKMLSINRIVNAEIGSSYSPKGHLYRRFMVTIFQIPLEEIVFWNDIKVYDIKYASKLIWGKDIRDKIAVCNSDELPLFSAVRPLLNKYIGLCLLSPLTYYGDVENADSEKIMECGKTYVEIGTSACIIDGKYVPSYRHRMDIIDREVRWLPQRLKDKILTYTKLKLNPSSHKDLFSLDTNKLWFETREDLNSFFLKILKKACGLCWTDGWASYVNLWVQRMRRQALLPYFDFYLRKRWGMSSTYVCHLFNFLYERYFSYRVLKESGFQGVRALMLRTNPLFEIYGLGILLANSVNRDSTINRNYLHTFMERQKKIPSIKYQREHKTHVEELDDILLFSHCAKLLSKKWSVIQRAFYGA